ncbi:MAG: NAD(+) synthase [Deltaproteobacteria bacterium]|nr:NAD(+) synthase [Deltaproteobacteria bacterium]
MAALHPDLLATLEALRAWRGFQAPAWLRGKVALVNDYLRATGARACVVGVSGGVDSAVALGLLCRASREDGSPLERVVAALLPVRSPDGATGQEEALARGSAAARCFGAEAVVADLTAGHEALRRAVDGPCGSEGDGWAAGQLVSTVRTPALYYLASRLGALVCGTTNRDEGAWLGFFGKASDGMVDLQPLSDLHKSEVYAVARLLGAPTEILAAPPAGDTWDGRTDEEMLGVPYDLVELHAGLLGLPPGEREGLVTRWSPEARARWRQADGLLTERHRRNAHKYLGDSPAVHLDVYPRALPGGWRRAPIAEDFAPVALPPPVLPGRFELPEALLDALRRSPVGPVEREAVADFGPSAGLYHGVLGAEACAALCREASRHRAVGVGLHGRPLSNDLLRDPLGSWRVSAVSEALAGVLWERLGPSLDAVRVCSTDTPTDHGGHAVWRAVGLSPVFRFMAYGVGGRIVPHYDAGFDYQDGRRHTLMSVLFYLTDAAETDGGATRLLHDPQRALPLSRWDFTDRETTPQPREVLAAVSPRRGSALVFDHRLLHDLGTWFGQAVRWVLRTDVVFERCGLPAAALRWPPETPRGALHARLGVPPGAPQDAVDRAYVRAARDAGDSGALRLAWQVLRDPYLAHTSLALGAEDDLKDAGSFDDRATERDLAEPWRDPRWLSTPLHKVLDGLRRAGPRADGTFAPLVVLVSTGAFCPVHRGHLSMLERAREALEARGFAVLGGYLSPSHDLYVNMKCADRNPGASHRVALCEEAVRGSDWLAVDPWEALYARRALNFTWVLERLERYLALHLPTHRRPEVAYVFGGDNAGFARAFEARGRFVCVARPGSEERVARVRRLPGARDNPRGIFTESARDAPEASSRDLRGGAPTTTMEPRTAARWTAWTAPPGPPDRGRVYLRNEGPWLLEPWRSGRDPEALAVAHRAFVGELLDALREAFRGALALDRAAVPEVHVLDLEHQREELARRTEGRLTLSLDPCLPGAYNLGISRCFELSTDKDRGFTERPGTAALPEQLAALPPGGYTLVDDDTVSGATLRAVSERLPPGRSVVGVVTLCDAADLEAADFGWTELCDARDFLAGSREGGLVVSLPDGALARAPYLLPYVSPTARARVPRSTEVQFSQDLWALNERFYRRVQPALLVRDAHGAFRVLAHYLGFGDDAPLAEVCAWHKIVSGAW